MRDLSLVGVTGITVAFAGMSERQLRHFVEALTDVAPPKFTKGELVELSSTLFHDRVDRACHEGLMRADADTIRVLMAMLDVEYTGDASRDCELLTDRMEAATKLRIVRAGHGRVDTFLRDVLKIPKASRRPQVLNVLWATVELAAKALDSLVASQRLDFSKAIARACLSDSRSCVVVLVAIQKSVCDNDFGACVQMKDAVCGLITALTGGALGAVPGAGDILGPLGYAVGASCGEVPMQLSADEKTTIRDDFAQARRLYSPNSAVSRAIRTSAAALAP